MPLNVVMIVALVTLGSILIAVAIFLPKLSVEKRAGERMRGITAGAAVRNARTAGRNRVEESAKRRKNVQDTLKEIEDKTANKTRRKLTLSARLKQAGLKISKPMYFLLSFFSALIFVFIGFLMEVPPLLLLGFAFVGFFGFPGFMLNYLKNRRINKFTNDLPEAIDIMVRGIKAGLPLMDGMRLVASEAREPLAGEFRGIIDAQQLGVPMSEAVMRIHDNIPIPETNFFATVVAIQQSSGGSLSEALANLGRVLRERKKMRMKVKAISSEAKASAGIIGSLPVFVALAVYFLNPDYISLLFTTSTGHLILGGSLFWMFCGVMIMRKMINFEI